MLTEKEFEEQKTIILTGLEKLCVCKQDVIKLRKASLVKTNAINPCTAVSWNN